MAALEPLPHHWLALCLCTESNRPEEWPYVAAVIFNRLLSSRFPSTMEGVILQPQQFSAFNPYTRDAEARRRWASRKMLYVSASKRQDAVLLAHAIDAAGRLEHLPLNSLSEISADTLHYYSPISMVPKGSTPAWAKTAKRLYTPEGIDPNRFVFVEGVA